MPMPPDAARLLRNGGIDACAALNYALIEVLAELPTDMHSEIKRSIGRAMASILDETVHKAMLEYPELEPDEETWTNAVKLQLTKRITS